MSTADEAAYIINDSTPDIVFCSKKNEETLRKALDLAKQQPNVVIFEDMQRSVEQLKYNAPDFTFPDFDTNKTAVIIYTSGTTGSPKGVMLSFGNLEANVTAVSEGVKIFMAQDKTLAFLPLHHILPLLGAIIAPIYTGGTIVFSKSLANEDIMEALSHGVSIIIGVPRFYDLIARGIKAKIDKSFAAKILYKLAAKINSQSFSKKIFGKVHGKMGGNMKYMVCGGAKLDLNTIDILNTLGFTVLEGYGMSETSPMITFPRPDFVKKGSVGQALPGCEIKFDNEEIIVSGPNVMQGYYNRPEETNDVLQDGWLKTGDLGEIDKDGHIFITGRRKEIIVLANGKNINPIELEYKITDISPYIKEIGIYEDSNILKAVICPDYSAAKKDGIENIEAYIKEEVLGKFNTSVSPYKRIKNITIYNKELPKTRIGKLKRYALPEIANNVFMAGNDEEEPDTREYKLIKQHLEKEIKKTILPDNHVEFDLGLDSLNMIELQVYISNTFGIEIKEEQITELGTIEKISDYVRINKTKLEEDAVKWSAIFKDITDVKLPASWFTHGIIMTMARIFFKLYFRIKGRGLENLPEGPFILAPNHQSFFDGMFVTIFLRNKLLKRTYFYAKEKHVKNRLIKFIARTHNVIVMDINKDLKLSIQKLAAALKKDKNIIIFPEGTRTKNGKLGQFKKTFAILSRELNVPIVPIAINGAYDALPSGSKIPRPRKKITVNFLNPIYPENYSYEVIKNKVYEKVAACLKK